MDTNQILSADLLDLVFANRNKDYGAYELRRTYSNRIIKSLVFTGIFVTLVFTGVVLANKNKKSEPNFIIHEEVTISQLKPDKKQTVPLPETPAKKAPTQVRSEILTPIVIAKNDEVINQPPTQEQLDGAIIDVVERDGTDFDKTVIPQHPGEGKGIIEEKAEKNEDPLRFVEIDAKFDGNWEKFLLRNLNPQTPVDNEAPTGNYTVWIQFVVDTDGSVSDIKALTNIGYGLEQEAIRVIQKAKKWDPAIQNGRQVKAYRKQAITFQVTGEE